MSPFCPGVCCSCKGCWLCWSLVIFWLQKVCKAKKRVQNAFSTKGQTHVSTFGVCVFLCICTALVRGPPLKDRRPITQLMFRSFLMYVHICLLLCIDCCFSVHHGVTRHYCVAVTTIIGIAVVACLANRRSWQRDCLIIQIDDKPFVRVIFGGAAVWHVVKSILSSSVWWYFMNEYTHS